MGPPMHETLPSALKIASSGYSLPPRAKPESCPRTTRSRVSHAQADPLAAWGLLSLMKDREMARWAALVLTNDRSRGDRASGMASTLLWQ